MKIAVMTKPNMVENDFRARALDFLRGQSGVEIVECNRACDIPKDSDKVLVFGGDGTMLEAASEVSEAQIPILGVNLGHLGFLTELESPVSFETILNALKSTEYSKRMLICASIGDKECKRALNEVVLKSNSSRPIYVKVYIDGAYLDTYHSDGVIISTPTGSTAYALSAGGPVLSPDVDAFVILPICAHSLHSRPIVVNSNSSVILSVLSEEDATVCVDGNAIYKTVSGDKIFVSRAPDDAIFVALKGSDFYKKLLQKMNGWGTTQPS